MKKLSILALLGIVVVVIDTVTNLNLLTGLGLTEYQANWVKAIGFIINSIIALYAQPPGNSINRIGGNGAGLMK